MRDLPEEMIYRGLELFYPDLYFDAVEIKEINNGDDLEILMGNGDRFIFDGYTERIRGLPRDKYNMSEAEYRREFALRLKTIMARKFISEQELSERTGILQPTLSRYLNQKVTPGLRALDKIAKALNCSIDDLTYR